MHGVPNVWNAHTRTFIDAGGYFIIVGGDQPAVAKLMNMKGHKAISPCRTCRLFGCFCPHPSGKGGSYYYPLRAPNDWNAIPRYRQLRLGGHHYDAANLPLRTHANYLVHLANIEAADNKDEAQIIYGIKGDSIFRNLSSLKFPTSFPFGMAHLVCLNVVKRLVEHATDNFASVPNKGQPYAIPSHTWKSLSRQLAEATATVPACYGKAFKDLSSEIGFMVSEDWLNFLLYASEPVFATAYTSPQSKPCLELWKLLAEVVEESIQYSIKRKAIAEIRTKIQKFVTEYERFVHPQYQFFQAKLTSHP
ncbi:hypothetical protein BOTBODRAFT_122380 [Botryobasidium botryosum FD-172 SS1]|uniref:Uncharacterized protein n=1 Tax=Botryobasidium botryosum (strain FD-172 SS1) TaxID=930990 RepID=A0A067M269_BOTB1|nr:hypothetical protein BOTBODRAFT_122380 [Botryobasidium botryosum FD-172 SS1]